MGQTLAEKILSRHAGREVTADELIVVPVSGAMASDTTSPYAIKAFREMGGEKLFDPKKCFLVIDHAYPASYEDISNLHVMMREFAHEQNCVLYDGGEGICHQLIVQKWHVRPGDIFIGADSHTCTYGALGAFSTGVGSTDLAAVWLTGKIWLKVPRSIKVVLQGKLPSGAYSKDIILRILGEIGVAGATYKSIEFCGEAIEKLSLGSRMTIANMAIEAGAKTGFVHMEGLELPYEHEFIYPDEDAVYDDVINIDVSSLKPMVALHPSPGDVVEANEVKNIKINYAFIGSCVNGRLEDLHAAAQILEGNRVHRDVRLLIGPASRQVFLNAAKDGTIETLSKAGATFIPSGCGPCVGTHLGVPGDNEVVISTGNRNFVGRMGNAKSKIYLASPATVAYSAIVGYITNLDGEG
ncbi:3-isopropylmalate dehydratase large subunit [Spirochaetota bacterium]